LSVRAGRLQSVGLDGGEAGLDGGDASCGGSDDQERLASPGVVAALQAPQGLAEGAGESTAGVRPGIGVLVGLALLLGRDRLVLFVREVLPERVLGKP
jgi:hypothetical protein